MIGPLMIYGTNFMKKKIEILVEPCPAFRSEGEINYIVLNDGPNYQVLHLLCL